MNVKEEETRHIAMLARIKISDEEAKFYSKELSSILSYVEKTKEVDIKEAASKEGKTEDKEKLGFSEDALFSFGDRDKLLNAAKAEKDGFIKIKATLDKDNE